MNYNEVVALEDVLEDCKFPQSDNVKIVKDWLSENYCKDCKNQIKNLETGEDTICACDVPF